MKRITRPSPAMLVALIALFATFGGTSYAAAKFGSAQIKNNSVKGVDVKNRALAGKDVKTNALGGTQIDEAKLGQVPSAATADRAASAQSAGSVATAQKAGTADSVKTAQNAVNAQSAPTAANASKAGDTGKLGGHPLAAFARDMVYVSLNTPYSSDNEKTVSVGCPAGTHVIAGGGELDGPTGENVAMTDTTAVGDSGWTASAVESNPVAGDWRLSVEATCAVIE